MSGEIQSLARDLAMDPATGEKFMRFLELLTKPRRICLTRTEAATALGVNVKTFDTFKRVRGIKAIKHLGTYPVSEIEKHITKETK